MPFTHGKFRPVLKASQGKAPLDPTLPQYTYNKPSISWRLAVHVPIIVIAALAFLLVVDRFRDALRQFLANLGIGS